MAIKTKCLTPGCIFSTHIQNKNININISLPDDIHIDKKEAEILEAILHNNIEIALRPYFYNKQKERFIFKILKRLNNYLLINKIKGNM